MRRRSEIRSRKTVRAGRPLTNSSKWEMVTIKSSPASATIVAKKTEKLPVGDLEMMTDVLREHRDDLGDFVTLDPKGSNLLPFLFGVTES